MSHLHPKRRRTVAGAALLTATALSASACTSAVSQQNATHSSAAPQAGGTLVAAQVSDPDPGSFLKTSVGNILAEYSVFETLTLIDKTTGKPKGVLAKSWTLAPDGKSMDITLRDDATFASGAKLTAQDVIFTLKKVQDPATGAANLGIATAITGMDAVNEHELKLTFSKPLPNIFDLFETMPIANPLTYAKNAAGEQVDGTGPFAWKSWTPGSKIELVKRTDYRDASKIHLDRIEIDIIKDPTALVSAMRSGRVEYAVGMAALDSYSLSKQPGYQLITSGGAAIPLAFDVTQKPFDNKLVRQAAQYAIDRQRIVQQVESGQAVATSLPWRKSTVGYDQTQGQRYTYDPAKAKQLLAQAGVTNASFKVVTLNNPEATGIFQIVKNNLDAVGLHAEAVPLTATDYDARIAASNMGTPVFQMQASNGLSPASAVVSRPELRTAKNPTNFNTPEYSQLVKAVTTATDESAQSAALKAFNDYFLDQAFAVPLVTRPTLSVATSSVQGITSTQMGFINLNQAFLTE